MSSKNHSKKSGTKKSSSSGKAKPADQVPEVFISLVSKIFSGIRLAVKKQESSAGPKGTEYSLAEIENECVRFHGLLAKAKSGAPIPGWITPTSKGISEARKLSSRVLDLRKSKNSPAELKSAMKSALSFASTIAPTPVRRGMAFAAMTAGPDAVNPQTFLMDLLDILTGAIVIAETRKALTGDDTEIRDLDNQIIYLLDQITKSEKKLKDLKSGASFPPPSPELVKEVVKLSGQVDELIHQQEVAAGVISVIKGAVAVGTVVVGNF